MRMSEEKTIEQAALKNSISVAEGSKGNRNVRRNQSSVYRLLFRPSPGSSARSRKRSKAKGKKRLSFRHWKCETPLIQRGFHCIKTEALICLLTYELLNISQKIYRSVPSLSNIESLARMCPVYRKPPAPKISGAERSIMIHSSYSCLSHICFRPGHDSSHCFLN